jgi:hypothetical protein
MPSPTLSYYQSLITSEYQTAPNFLAWLNIALARLTDASNTIDAIQGAFDFDAAAGAQLDALGTIIGQSRTVGFQPSSSVSPVLDDTTYRILLKARIAQNDWDGTIDSLQVVWQSLFPGGRIAIVDAQNMTATIIVSGPFTSILQDLISNGYIVPRPEGVLYAYSFSALPQFGFDQNSTYIAGYNTGKWS